MGTAAPWGTALRSRVRSPGSFREGRSPTILQHQQEGKAERGDEGSPFLSRGLLKSQIFADLRISKFKKGRSWKKKSEGRREGCGCSK